MRKRMKIIFNNHSHAIFAPLTIDSFLSVIKATIPRTKQMLKYKRKPPIKIYSNIVLFSTIKLPTFPAVFFTHANDQSHFKRKTTPAAIPKNIKAAKAQPKATPPASAILSHSFRRFSFINPSHHSYQQRCQYLRRC